MYKKLILWLFFTIFVGVLPFGLKWFVCYITSTAFTYLSMCSEVFFFNLLLSANGLKELYDIDSDKKLKILLYSTLVFIIIIIAVIYGILLLNDYLVLGLNIENIPTYSWILTLFCVICNFSIQLLGGV